MMKYRVISFDYRDRVLYSGLENNYDDALKMAWEFFDDEEVNSTEVVVDDNFSHLLAEYEKDEEGIIHGITYGT